MAVSERFYSSPAHIVGTGTDAAVLTLGAAEELANAVFSLYNADVANTEGVTISITRGAVTKVRHKFSLAPETSTEKWLGHLQASDVVRLNASADVSGQIDAIRDA